MSVIVRDERPGDEAAIHAITAAAFHPMPYGDGTEPFIIDALRASGDLTLSLVAEQDGEIVGQVTFSPVTIDTAAGDWFGLGPVAVAPARQGEGIGGALIREGLSRIRQMGAAGCVLTGDPAYYARFGFTGDCGLIYSDVPSKYVQALAFDGDLPSGTLNFCDTFEAAVANKDA
ncbi:MAG: N-acetyltransferase [Pseudomonadota bacterium]